MTQQNLYLCNATPRHFHLHYRLPGGTKLADPRKVFSVNIPAGGQKDIASFDATNRMDDADIAHVIKQIEVCGARTVSDASKETGFSGLVYSTTRPVNVDAIHQGLDETAQIEIDRALESRKMNAMAADKVLADGAAKSGGNIAPLEVEVTEEAKPGDDPNAQRRQETIQVDRPGATPRQPRNRKG